MEVMEETEIKVEVEELAEPLALVKRADVEGVKLVRHKDVFLQKGCKIILKLVLVKRAEVEGEAEVSTTTPGELLITSSGGRGETFLLRQIIQMAQPGQAVTSESASKCRFKIFGLTPVTSDLYYILGLQIVGAFGLPYIIQAFMRFTQKVVCTNR